MTTKLLLHVFMYFIISIDLKISQFMQICVVLDDIVVLIKCLVCLGNY